METHLEWKDKKVLQTYLFLYRAICRIISDMKYIVLFLQQLTGIHTKVFYRFKSWLLSSY